MTELEHQKRLRINRVYIVDNLLCLNEVLDHLFNDEVFSEAAVDNIKHTKEESEKIRLILDYLYKKSSDKFDKFCSILDKTSNELTAAKLRNHALTQTSNKIILGGSSLNPSSSSSLPIEPVRSSQKDHGVIDDGHKKIFQSLLVECVENMLDVESVVDSLMSQELIKSQQRSFIFKDDERRQQVRSLMFILSKKGNRALPAFLNALNISGNEYLYEKVLNAMKKVG